MKESERMRPDESVGLRVEEPEEKQDVLLERILKKARTIGKVIGVPALIGGTLVTLYISTGNAQFPVNLPSEFRGFLNRQGVGVDSVFAYSKTLPRLDGAVLSLADTVTAAGDTVRGVPDYYSLQIRTDDASTPNTLEGAVAGDTIYFEAKAPDGTIYPVVAIGEAAIHNPGEIMRKDLKLELPVAVGDPPKTIPEEFALHQNYPNPFNPETTIGYELDKRANVRITVYDLTGKVVKRLVDGTKTAGRYEAVWDGTDKNNIPVASGVYFYRARIGNKIGNNPVETRKMTLLR